MSLPSIDHLFFFGRFNVAHLGYILAIQTALKVIKPKKLVLVPSSDHPTWNKKVLSFDHRIKMLERALDSELTSEERKQVSISRLELELVEEGKTGGYTVNALRHLKKQYPTQSLGILMGADAVASFDQWKDWQEILKLAHLFVVPRAKVDTVEGVAKQLPRALLPYYDASAKRRIHLIPLLQISSATHASSSAVLSGETRFLPQSVKSYTVLHALL